MVSYTNFLDILASQTLQNKHDFRYRPISFFETDFFKIFSPIFGQLPIFDWPPIPIFQNLLTDIFANILTKFFSLKLVPVAYNPDLRYAALK